MYCESCGTENPDHAVFCQSCGRQVNDEEGVDTQTLINEERGKRKNQFIGGGIILSALVISIMIITFYFNGQEDTGFKQKLQAANHYLEEMDYKKAEASFLEAIKVNPKAEEPYLELSRLYAKQGKTEKAEKILETGEKKTGSRKIKENLEEIKTQQVAVKREEKAAMTKDDLAATGTFPDDESNELGIISSWEYDVDGDGNKETLTTESQSHRQMKMLITLRKQDSSNTLLDQIKPEEPADDHISYGDDRCSIFIKKNGDQYYLVVDDYGASQSYSSWYSTFTIYELGKRLSKKCEIETQWYRGESTITVDGKTVYKDGYEEQEAGNEEHTQEALSLLKETLKPYGMEEKAYIEENEGGILLISGYDDSIESEINISKSERIQTGDTVDGNPEMEVRVEDYTQLREEMGEEAEEGTDEAITLDSSLQEITSCLDMYREEIEAEFGALSDESNFYGGGYGYRFENRTETIYFYDPPGVNDEENQCSAVQGTVSQIIKNYDETMSIEAFEETYQVALEALYPGDVDPDEDEYLATLSDGRRLFLTASEGMFHPDTEAIFLPNQGLMEQ